MLELKDVSYVVKDENGEDKAILKNINLKIDERFVAITGPNGGGKSTLAKIIAGIATPDSGKLILVHNYLQSSCKFLVFLSLPMKTDTYSDVVQDERRLGKLGRRRLGIKKQFVIQDSPIFNLSIFSMNTKFT
mgnify:CR=1 FL=1